MVSRVWPVLVLAAFLVIGCSLLVQAEMLEITPSQIRLVIPLSPEADFRVWHTTNPMKVVADIYSEKVDCAFNEPIQDTALRDIRTSSTPDKRGTRIVMDFNYRVSEPSWFITEDHALILEVNKIFVDSSLRRISPGVRYGHQRRGIEAGPVIVNYIEVDLTNPANKLRSVLAQDQVYGRELVSSMARRTGAIVAVNGLYFAPDGRPLGLLAMDGRLISEPYANRTALGIKDGEAIIASVDFCGSVSADNGESFPICGFNRPRGADQLIIYTSDYGTSTRTNIYGIDVVLEDGRVSGIYTGDAPIPLNGVVLSGHGKAKEFLQQFDVGDMINWEYTLIPDWLAEGFEILIGGGPRLVKDGEVFITGEEERFQNDILKGRAPRTAIGLTQDQRLLLVTVNGRRPGISIGMTLEELARLMIELGAVEAMNLDGGGSTTMVIHGRVLNLPSDGVERPVSNALVVITQE